MSWLSNSDLERALVRHGDVRVLNAFAGICPNDALPRTELTLPVFIVVNTDPHNLPGRHWKVIYINEQRHGEVFDSLATPLSNHVIRFMNQHASQWKSNRCMFQHPLSTQCGVYVLYYMTHRLDAPSLQVLCQHFSYNLNHNEMKMSRFYRQLK